MQGSWGGEEFIMEEDVGWVDVEVMEVLVAASECR